MGSSFERWIDGLQFSSLFWRPPQDAQQRKAQITAYVELFGQFISEQFPEDVAELIRNRYPSKEMCLLDDVLAMFVLHHPEHGHAVILPLISSIFDGTLEYDRTMPPFASFISSVCPTSENEYPEEQALACEEILRILTQYNRPQRSIVECEDDETDRSNSGSHATTSSSKDGKSCHETSVQHERKSLRPLSPWITDMLLAAPLQVKSGYFRWCGGVMGKYAAGELKPPTTSSRGSGKHPQLVPSTPRWAVAYGAGVILSVCDQEVNSYESATLTEVAVPALLLPPPTTSMDEHLVAGLPALEPYARLFHRYYAISAPSATQRLLLGLLEAPPSWAPDALDAAVQLVELLRAAEDYASGVRLPMNWMHLHFLRAIGTAMSMRAGIAADAAAALLFRILSQPALLFPPLRQVDGVDIQREPVGGFISILKNQKEAPAAEATIEATAQGIASMLCGHGPEVEWRICTIWEAAYGLIPLSSSVVDLPDIIVATPLQTPVLSWNLYIPLLKVLEYLPRGSPSEACLMKIFVATVEAILQRTFPLEPSREQIRKTRYLSGIGSTSKNLVVAELRTMVHSLFVESPASVDLASSLLFVVLTMCVTHDAQTKGNKRQRGENRFPADEIAEESLVVLEKQNRVENGETKKQGAVAAFDSYVLAAVCALACELQLFPLISEGNNHSGSKDLRGRSRPTKINGSPNGFQNSLNSAIRNTCRILSILEAFFSLKSSSVGTSWSYSPNEIVAAAMVAAHVSELCRNSKACMHALSVLMRCKWDKEIHHRASSLHNLIDIHGKTVASIVDKAEPLEAHLLNAPVWKGAPVLDGRKKTISSLKCSESHYLLSQQHEDNRSQTLLQCSKSLHINEKTGSSTSTGVTSFPVDASELANFLTMDRLIGFNCSAQVPLRSALAEKQELCFSVVSLLWHKLIAGPETLLSAEGTSTHRGWRQVVDALCNVVSASPTKAATAVVLQAERELQPWIAKDDEQSQKRWSVNQRIVKLIAELMRNHERPESLAIVATAWDLLLRATDGMLVDGEACTLPQLELLEATAKAVQPVLEWGESGSAIADGLSNLLKCRISSTIRCLSHPSAHVRALSTSVLRDILHCGSINPATKQVERNNMHARKIFSYGVINWQADIEKCLTWEAHSRLATGLPIQYLDTAAKELNCSISL